MDKPTTSKKRKVSDENRSFQNKWTTDYYFINVANSPTCLICQERISVVKEYNLKRHYETKHRDGRYGKLEGEKRMEQITKLKSSVASQQSMFPKLRDAGVNIVRASFVVSYNIAKNLKPFSDGEFIKQCINDVAQILFPDQVDTVEKISLSRRTITRRIDEIAMNLSDSLKQKSAEFIAWSFCTDEMTDRSDTAQLVIFVKGIDDDLNEFEEMLALKPMNDTTTGSDLFEQVTAAIEEFDLKWETLCGMTTDGAPSMSGRTTGLVGRIKTALQEKVTYPNDVVFFHCIIHQENLCAKALQFRHVIGPVVKAINFIRHRGLNHRQFKAFLEELDTVHRDVVYYTEVRWLSKGRMLRRFFQLREEIRQFLDFKGQNMVELDDRSWMLDLAFIVDLTMHMNELNLKLQKKGQYAHEMFAHINAFKAKLNLWRQQIEKLDLSHFSTLSEYSGGGHLDNKQTEFAAQIQKLIDEFSNRFQDLWSQNATWKIFATPLDVLVNDAPPELQLELIELQNQEEMKIRFNKSSIGDFYRNCITRDEFPNLRAFAAKKMALFGSTYVCEQIFSRLNFMKSPFRSTLSDENLENGLRVATSSFIPDIDKISKDIQTQRSH